MKRLGLYKIIMISICFGILFGCQDSWLDEKPDHLLTAETLYQNLDGFEAGINGLYSHVRKEKGTINGSVGGGVGMFINGTDLFCTNGNDANKGTSTLMSQWGTLSSPEHFMYELTFIWLYEVVNAANMIINRAAGDNINWVGNGNTPEENRNLIVADARAIRAYAYRHLSNSWGDVPLNLEESAGSTIKTDWQRSPVGEVRKQIISDFLFAEKHIPIEATLPGRMTKGAVQTFLAEMYLVIDKPDSTLYWADQVISNPAYQLVTKRYGARKYFPGVVFMDMFLDGNANREEGNTESLWTFNLELNTEGGGYGIYRRVLASQYHKIELAGSNPFQITNQRGGRPGGGWIALTKFAMDNYEPQDDRFSNHVIRKYLILQTADGNFPYEADILPVGYNYGDTIHFDWSEQLSPTHNSIKDWPWSRKVDGFDPDNRLGTPQFNDLIYMRLAETYLLKAEAQVKLGSLVDAAETVNIIRRRSNASEVSSGDMDIDFILDERGRELLVEGHRRHSLLRNGKWLERTRKYNFYGGENITDRDKLFPIPQVVIDANLTNPMIQNPGYN
jgi:hypothetical protein